jgi:hypothetical protein
MTQAELNDKTAFLLRLALGIGTCAAMTSTPVPFLAPSPPLSKGVSR